MCMTSVAFGAKAKSSSSSSANRLFRGAPERDLQYPQHRVVTKQHTRRTGLYIEGVSRVLPEQQSTAVAGCCVEAGIHEFECA